MVKNKQVAMYRSSLIGFALCLSVTACLEAEAPVLGPGGFAGSSDGATAKPDTTDGSCAADTDCPDGELCTVDRCIEGVCTHTPADGATCEDGNKCTTGEVCAAGACSGGAAVPCDDGSACTSDTCNPESGGCVYPTIEGACDDGNPCTTGDHCASGKCVAAALKSCDDGNPCTSDSCNPSPIDGGKAGSCSHVPTPAPCDDGNACTTKDSCTQGQCSGAAMVCDDGKPCTGDTCLPKKGCDHSPTQGPCDDANACTTDDVCDDFGKCIGKAVPANKCDDANPCTNDVCTPAKGCQHALNSEPCDDGNSCTKGDKCALGTCHKGAKDPKCACASDKECQAFDKNLCDGTLVCNLATSTCELDTSTVIKCNPGLCFKATCITTTGKCSYANLPNGAGCDADNSKCTTGDSCKDGNCLVGTPASCDDSNLCTADSCDAKLGCVHDATGGPCDDGNKCTTGDTCAAKSCQPGLVKNCEDGNGCTKDSCDAKTGSCVHDSAEFAGDPCDADGSVCTVGDTCSGGKCTKGKALDCDDSNGCTADSCDPTGGKGCVHVPNAVKCDDNNPCTESDTCAGGKCQPGNPKSCVDGDKCTTDVCEASSGKCSHTAVAGCSTKCSKADECNDNNVCTFDTCDGGVCSNKNVTGACDDQSVCTANDVCNDGLCQGKAKNCDDGNGCTANACDAKSGCVATPLAGPCDADGSACTVGDACKAGGCVAGNTKKCDDGEACTKDSCDAKTGTCSFDAKSLDKTACDADGSVCTHGDTCAAGKCLPGPALKCDDNNDCTADSCTPGASNGSGAGKGSGCSHAALTQACDDDSKCTPAGTCQDGKCEVGAAKVCDDDNACTADSCEEGSGSCKFLPIANCANDCVTKADCDDKNPCSNDSCDVGKCKHTARTGKCSDGSKCYLAGDCIEGKCAGGKQVVCNDNNECTTDVCDGAVGTCNFAGNSDPCDDLDACTVGDKCSFATCVSGTAKACDDSNPCTDDVCDKKLGKCVTTANSAKCDDGDACTLNDHCTAGKCAAGLLGTATLTAGKGSTGQQDGPKETATFNYPRGIWADGKGTAYVAGGPNDTIRTVDADGNVKVFAGMGAAGYSNGPRLKALFSNPQGIVGDAQGNLYVTDTDNHVVRIIDTNGVVANFAGDGKAGMVDGYGIKARLHAPAAIDVDGAGLYITDSANHTVLAITLDGLVHTLAGTGKSGFKDGPGATAQFDIPMGVAAAKDGSVYVGDAANHRIRRIASNGVVSTVSGTGLQGKANGVAKDASFIFPQGLHLLPNGALLIADRQNHLIRQLHNGQVTTVLGDGLIATMYEPLELASDGESNVWVVDSKNHRIVRFALPQKVCDDGNGCTSNACDAKTGKCAYTNAANGTACGDGCFDNQICKDAKCQFGTPKNCNDYNACTNDYCSTGVCKHVPVAGCK